MLFSIFFRRVILKKSSGFIFVDKMYNSDEILFILSAISSHFSVEKKSQVIEICAVKSQVCTYLSEGNVIIKLLPFSICLFHPVFFMQCLFNVIWSGRPSFIENLLFLDEDFQDAIAIKCGVNWNEKKWFTI